MIDFNYSPMSEEQAMQERFSLMPEGEYQAVVEKYTPKTSKKGNAMAELVLHVYDANGRAHQIYDWLVFSTGMAWKLRHFCISAGLEKEYDEGRFHPDMAVGKNVVVKVVVQMGQEIPADRLNGKAPGAKYPDKNAVEDYILGTKPDRNVPSEFSDDIPF